MHFFLLWKSSIHHFLIILGIWQCLVYFFKFWNILSEAKDSSYKLWNVLLPEGFVIFHDLFDILPACWNMLRPEIGPGIVAENDIGAVIGTDWQCEFPFGINGVFITWSRPLPQFSHTKQGQCQFVQSKCLKNTQMHQWYAPALKRANRWMSRSKAFKATLIIK